MSALAALRAEFDAHCVEQDFEPSDDYWRSWVSVYTLDHLWKAIALAEGDGEGGVEHLRGLLDRDFWAAPAYGADDPEGRIRELKAMPYAEYLRTPEWRTTRRLILLRADGRCQVCNTTEYLNVHHRTYQHRGVESPGDLTVLCSDCHGLFHRNGRIQ